MFDQENDVLIDEDEPKLLFQSKGEIFRTLAILSSIWVFAFTAFSGLQNLESSLNPDIGVYSLASITGGGLISCILAPSVISILGIKGSLIGAGICLSIFVATNYFIDTTYALIPGAIIYGLSSGILWCAQGSYVTTLAVEYCNIDGQNLDTILGRFFGIFCMAFQSTQIWGNLISSTILQSGESDSNDTSSNSTCGAEFCQEPPPSNTTDQNTVSHSTHYTLISVYLGCSLIGLSITIFLLKAIPNSFDGKSISTKTILGETLRLLVTDLNMALLVPIAMYSGVEQVVMYAEFTRAYVACELGISWVGYTMICFGVVNTIASPLNGILTKYTGRPILYLFAFLINTGLLILLRLWTPDKDSKFVFFVIPAAWALGDAIWQTQNSALIGYAFTENREAGFGNLRMFEASGFFFAYLYSNFLCVDIKLYIVGGLLVLSFILLMVVELRLKLRKRYAHYSKLKT